MGRNESSMSDKYICELFAGEDEHLTAIRESLRADGKEGINVAPHEGKLLQVLVGLAGAKKVVEVGTLYGYSALWIARALPEDGKLYCLEKSEENFAKAKELLAKSEVSGRIDLRCGDAEEILDDLTSDGPFDIIFIDANKAGYDFYLNWAEKNIRQGGLIIGDNTFLFGHLTGDTPWVKNVSEAQVTSMKSFNQRLSDPSKYRSVMVQTKEGMTIAQKL